MKKALIILAILIPGIIILVATTGTRAIEPVAVEEVPVMESAMAVEGVEVSLGKLIGSVEVSGIVEGTAEAYVVAELGGTISSVNVGLGDYVNAGEPLMVLADRGEGTTLEQIAAQLENAEREYSASEKLYAKGAASEADLTRSKSALRGVESAYKRALDAKDARILTSPINGYIADIDPGAALGNILNPGTRVARIVDLSALKMRVSLGERQIALVEKGIDATIAFNSAPEMPSVSARVTAVAAGTDPSTGSYRMIIEWPNTYSVTRSGMTATAVISTNEPKELIIPAAALITRQGTTGGFIYNNGIADFRPIETGRRFGDSVIVTSGVEEGEVLLVSGTTSLVDGDVVAVTVLSSVGVKR